MADSTPQRLSDGRYELRRLIGRGGMAEVHLGYDTRLSRPVAIKMLRTDLARDAIFLARFRREAQAAASLNHPNIVGVYDTGERMVVCADGVKVAVPYIIMEYVEGHTVHELMTDGQPIPINEAVEIITGVLNALEFSHAHGLVHRDIKPGNVMLTMTGEIKVMDFGIARALEDSGANMTQTDAVVGTAQYLSPEQARGEQVDTRSDLYSAGCMLFELMTGRPPFRGDSAVAVAYQHVSEAPPIPSSIAPDIAPELDRVILKSLAKRPAERYQDAASMRADLKAALRGNPVTAPELAALKATPQPTRHINVVPSPELRAAQRSDAHPPLTLDTRQQAAQQQQLQRQQELDEQRRKRRNSAIWATLLTILVIVAGAALGYYIYQRNQAPKTVVIPATVVSQSVDEARASLERLGLTVTEGDKVASSEIDKGLVAETDPAAGTQVQVGSRVTLHVSSGPKEVAVPDVSNLSQDDARTALEEAGLRVGNVSQEDSASVTKDNVIRTQPGAGTAVSRDQKVTLILASGYVEIDLAKVKDKPVNDAVGYLNDQLKLSTNTIERETAEAKPGTVISITPTGRVEVGSRVDVFVAKAPPAPSVPQDTQPSQPSDPSKQPTERPDDGRNKQH